MLNNRKITDYEHGGTQKDFYTQAEVEYCQCPFCNASNHKKIYQERGALGIVRCLQCSLVYVNPRLKNPEKIYWGNVDKYIQEARLIFNGRAMHHRDQNYVNDLKLISQYKPSGRFLDIGTNMGFFLRNARGKKWDLYGVEPSPSLSEAARKYFGLNVKTAFLEDAGFDNDFFDIVTMTDVFEHIPQPAKILTEVHRVLKPEGIVFIKVPNGSFNLSKLALARLFGKLKDYDLFDSYEHVVHYSHKTIGSMLEKCKFKIVRVAIGRPMQTPVWHNYVGQYYQYPSPWLLDIKTRSLRMLFYWLSIIEFWIRGGKVGCLAPNIIVIAKKRTLN